MTAILCIILLILFNCYDQNDASRRRWKRQTLPSENVQVHSFDSNVTITKEVHVNSSESRIELFEKNFASTIWSSSSYLRFLSDDGYIKLDANTVQSKMNLKSAQFYFTSDNLQFNETTNRKTDEETQLITTLKNNVNLSLADVRTTTQLEALDGKEINITGNSWIQEIERKLTLSSSILHDDVRQFTVNAISNEYNIIVTMNGAKIGIIYGKVRIDVESNYRKLILTTETNRVELNTFYSPFDLSITDDNLLIRAPEDKTYVKMTPNSMDIDIRVQQLSQMIIDDKGSNKSIQLNHDNNDVTNINKLDLTSKELQLNLFAGEIPRVLSDSNYSQLIITSNSTNANLVSQHHHLDVTDFTHHLLLTTGNISFDISENIQGKTNQTLLYQFVEPEDQFINIGPFDNITGNVISGNNITGSNDNNNFNETNNMQTINPNNQEYPGLTTPQTGDMINTDGSNLIRSTTVEQNTVVSSVIEPTTIGWNNEGINTIEPNDSGSYTTQTVETLWPETTEPAMSNSLEPNTMPPFIGPITPSNVENQTGSEDPNFPQPETPFPPMENNNPTDNFIIGQYGTDKPTTSSPEFPIFATITNIEVIHEDQIPESFPKPEPLDIQNSTATFLFSTSMPMLKRSLMGFKLRIDKNINNETLKAEMEKTLTDIASSLIQSNEIKRQKRTTEDIKIHVEDIEKVSNDNVIVYFYVDHPENFKNLSLLTSKLNEYGEDFLIKKFSHNKNESPTISASSNKNVVILVCIIVSSLLVIICSLLIFRYIMKRYKFRRYEEWWKVKDSSTNQAS